jgi:curved DNA-binding protein CbpA
MAASADETGLLTFILPDRKIEIHFRRGNPELIDSSHPEDSIARFALAQNWIDQKQLARAQSALNDYDGDLLTTLFGLKMVDRASAFESLGQRAFSLLGTALCARSGSFTFEPRQLPAHRAVPLGHRWAALTDVARRMSLVEIKQRMQAAASGAIRKTRGAELAAELQLTPTETRVLNRITGGKTLDQLTAEFPQEAEMLYRLAFLFRELHALSFSEAPQPNPPPAQAPKLRPSFKPAQPPKLSASPRVAPTKPSEAAAPAPNKKPTVDPPPAKAPSADDEKELRDLAAQVKQLKSLNHFQILGVGEKANGAAIKAAYFRLAKLHHPDTVSQGASAEFSSLKATLFGAIGEAYRKLSDEKARANYLESLKAGGPEEVDIAKILKAEDVFQRACNLIKGRKYVDGLAHLEDAIQSNPAEGEFYAWRGYARFLAAKNPKEALAEAQKDLFLAIKKNERCAPAYYFLGEVARMCGDNMGAMNHYKRAVELRPHYLEAQRQVRFLSSKR